MKTKNNLLLSLFLFSTATSLLALPMEGGGISFVSIETFDTIKNLSELRISQTRGKSYASCVQSVLERDNAVKAESNGNSLLAHQWNTIASLTEHATESFTQASNAYRLEKMSEGDCLEKVGSSLIKATEQYGNAIKADTDKKETLAQQLREAASFNEQASEHFIQGARAHAEESPDEASCLERAGNSSLEVAEKLVKAIKAEAGSPAIAQKWREIILFDRRAIDSFTEAAVMCNQGKKVPEIACDKTGGRCVIGSGLDLIEFNYGALQAAFNRRRANSAAEAYHRRGLSYSDASYYYGVALEAELNGNQMLAEHWRQAASLMERSIEPLIESTKAYLEGNQNKGLCLYNAGLSSRQAAEHYATAIGNKKNGDSSIDQKWNKVISLYERAFDPFLQAAEMGTEAKSEKRECFERAGLSSIQAGEKYHEAIVAETAGGAVIAEKWRQAAFLNERAFDSFIQASVAFLERKEEATPLKERGNCFFLAAKQYKKAIEADAAGDLILVQQWNEMVALHESASESYAQAAQAFAEGKTDEARSFNNAALSLIRAADQYNKALDAEISQIAEVPLQWRKAASLNKQAADAVIQSAKAYAEGKEAEAGLLNTLARNYFFEAEELADAIEAGCYE